MNSKCWSNIAIQSKKTSIKILHFHFHVIFEPTDSTIIRFFRSVGLVNLSIGEIIKRSYVHSYQLSGASPGQQLDKITSA